ncbi:unnamed protein product [Symbiodinium natans]|uniref:Uncharacterized protein n=1 Tax=Symbiodinium natans TaxID=878477 RepID=A0A812PWP9_9DINO|nr:unnamed protein product [Symbiodinium natans]
MVSQNLTAAALAQSFVFQPLQSSAMATKDGPRLLTREEVHAKRTAVLECLKKTEEHKFTQRMVQHFKDEKQPLPEPVPVTPEPMKPMSKRTWEKEFYNYKCAVRFYAQLHDKMFQ